ncbi:ATV_HP_G0008370.mRNA.1.CDS.1 [Saccharomyces cerevisiae]|nr:ATV_HP_G0008370.mRNA.1.CDS.1 [Saccharomyces cerevisiae]CAI6941636.1 ATV_HP_G0008370.mRNA.1.CDS.1 [Saccharomyces cerevisiae]
MEHGYAAQEMRNNTFFVCVNAINEKCHSNLTETNNIRRNKVNNGGIESTLQTWKALRLEYSESFGKKDSFGGDNFDLISNVKRKLMVTISLLTLGAESLII